MGMRDKINKILNEAIGGATGFSRTGEDTPLQHKNDDARRKRKERQGKQRLNKIKSLKDKSKAKDDDIIDPRLNMHGELRYTPKEAFLVHLVQYLHEGKSKHVMNALRLMEEYPNLAKYVRETSSTSLPRQAFSVYALREHFNEEVGSPAYRSGDNPHNWFLTVPCAKENCNHLDRHIIMEAKITPDKVLFYLPAFSKDIENLIFSGKIEEPEINVVRKAKNLQELILPGNIDTGMVIEIKT